MQAQPYTKVNLIAQIQTINKQFFSIEVAGVPSGDYRILIYDEGYAGCSTGARAKLIIRQEQPHASVLRLANDEAQKQGNYIPIRAVLVDPNCSSYSTIFIFENGSMHGTGRFEDMRSPYVENSEDPQYVAFSAASHLHKIWGRQATELNAFWQPEWPDMKLIMPMIRTLDAES